MSNSASWTKEEEKAFENAIATYLFDESDVQWNKLASMVPTKTIDEIKQHYRFLVEDVGAIEAGKVPLPNYRDDVTTLSTSTNKDNHHHPTFSKDQRGNSNLGDGYSGFGPAMGNSSKSSSKMDQERKKGIPWTEEEHRLFLLGLEKFGKGDWRSISRNFVITRTPTQVASHAQKYFIRLNSMNRDRRRSSIHDITNVNGGELPNQAPITGQSNNAGTPALGTVPPNKHKGQSAVNMAPPGMMYGTHIGHPVNAPPPPPLHHLASAVGTPVMLPPPGHPHHHHHRPPPPHYAVPVAYPVAPPPMHQ